MTTKPTVSRSDILDTIKESYLDSMVLPGWHAVRVQPSGEITQHHEVSRSYGADEYYGRKPHAVIVWASGTGTGTANAEDVENERENGDWDAWFEANVAEDLAETLEPTGVTLED